MSVSLSGSLGKMGGNPERDGVGEKQMRCAGHRQTPKLGGPEKNARGTNFALLKKRRTTEKRNMKKEKRSWDPRSRSTKTAKRSLGARSRPGGLEKGKGVYRKGEPRLCHRLPNGAK